MLTGHASGSGCQPTVSFCGHSLIKLADLVHIVPLMCGPCSVLADWSGYGTLLGSLRKHVNACAQPLCCCCLPSHAACAHQWLLLISLVMAVGAGDHC